MLSNRRSPLLGGLGAAAAPAYYRRPAKPAVKIQSQPPPPKAAAPTAAQKAASFRETARKAQMLKPRVERFGDQATLSREARAAAQDRLTQAALEYEMLWGGGSSTIMPTAPEGSQISPTGIAPAGGAGAASTSEVMPEMNKTAKARAAFITWLRDSNPEAYQAAMTAATANSVLSDIAPTTSTGFDWKRFVDAATAAATAVFTTKAQKDMLKVNIERAKAGLPPVDTSFAAPVIRTQFDVSPEVAQSLQQSAQAGFQNVALIGGAALLAFLLLRK